MDAHASARDVHTFAPLTLPSPVAQEQVRVGLRDAPQGPRGIRTAGRVEPRGVRGSLGRSTDGAPGREVSRASPARARRPPFPKESNEKKKWKFGAVGAGVAGVPGEVMRIVREVWVLGRAHLYRIVYARVRAGTRRLNARGGSSASGHLRLWRGAFVYRIVIPVR